MVTIYMPILKRSILKCTSYVVFLISLIDRKVGQVFFAYLKMTNNVWEEEVYVLVDLELARSYALYHYSVESFFPVKLLCVA